MFSMKTKANRTMVLLLIAMGIVTVALLAAAAYLFFKGVIRPFGNNNGALRAYVQAPALAEVGKTASMIVTVRNDSNDYLSLDEIRLPEALLDSADVAAIVPG